MGTAAKPIPRSTAIPVSDLISVADGAIVSREVLRNGGGTVTAFAFDAGEGLSEHSAPFDALVQVVSGRLDLVIGGREVTAEAGMMVIMPADVPHALHAPVASVMVLTMLKEGA
jgi:quercetin dioxygenase-like cupin family protein